MKKKTIAFVIGSLTAGGAERVISTLSNELIATYNIVIIELVKSNPFYKLDPAIKIVSCKSELKPSKNIFEAIRNNIFLLKKISNYIKSEKINLIIGFITNVNILTLVAARLNKIHCIISERNNPEIDNAPKKKWDFFREKLYKKADFLVVQTPLIKKFFDKLMEPEKVIILPNPLSSSFVEAYNKKVEKENIILNIGRLTAQKAQHLLINAFGNINNDNWKLIVVGEGDKKQEYESLIKKLNLNDKVILAGKSEDIESYYSKSKIFVLTSNFEGFPNVLIEAMYMGLACISTDCPTGPSDIIRNDENGYLIPMGDQISLEVQLKNLMSEKFKRESFGKLAHETASKFEAKKIVGKWEQLIIAALN